MYTDEHLGKTNDLQFPGSLEIAKQLSSNEKVKDSTGVPLPLCAHSKLLDPLPSSLGTHFFFLKRLTSIYIVFFVCFPLVSFIYNWVLWAKNSEFSGVDNASFGDLSFIQKILFNDMVKLYYYPADENPEKGLVQLITYIITLVTLYGFYVFFTFRIENHNATRLSEEINIPDYSLILENLPEKVTQNDIKEFLGSIVGKEVKIHRVELVFNVREQTDLLLFRKKRMIEKAKLSDAESLRVKQEEINELTKKINQNLEKFQKGELFSGKAIVTLEKSSQVEAVLKKNSGTFTKTLLREVILNLSCCMINLSRWNSRYELRGRKINIRVAPNPNEIIWRNFGSKKKDEILRKMASYTILFVTMCFAAIIIFVFYDIYYTKLLESYVDDVNGGMGQRIKYMIIAFIVIFLVFVVNIVSYALFEFIGDFLQPKVFSSQYAFLFISNCIHFIITNILVQYLAVFEILSKEVKGSNDEESVETRALMFQFFARNTILLSLLYSVYPVSDNLIKYSQKVYRIAKAFARPLSFTQGELNEMLSPMKYNSAVGMANYASLILFAIFYSNYVNTCSIGPFIACFVTYWTDKIMILRVCAFPRKYNFTVAVHTFKVLIVIQFLLSSLANFDIFNYSVFGEFRITKNYVFIICFFFFFGVLAYYSNQYDQKKVFLRVRVKMFDLCKKVNKKKPIFSKIQEYIEDDYQTKNPASPFFNTAPKKFIYSLEAHSRSSHPVPKPTRNSPKKQTPEAPAEDEVSQSFDMRLCNDSEIPQKNENMEHLLNDHEVDFNHVELKEEGTEFELVSNQDFKEGEHANDVLIRGDPQREELVKEEQKEMLSEKEPID